MEGLVVTLLLLYGCAVMISVAQTWCMIFNMNKIWITKFGVTMDELKKKFNM